MVHKVSYFLTGFRNGKCQSEFYKILRNGNEFRFFFFKIGNEYGEATIGRKPESVRNFPEINLKTFRKQKLFIYSLLASAFSTLYMFRFLHNIEMVS